MNKLFVIISLFALFLEVFIYYFILVRSLDPCFKWAQTLTFSACRLYLALVSVLFYQSESMFRQLEECLEIYH